MLTACKLKGRPFCLNQTGPDHFVYSFFPFFICLFFQNNHSFLCWIAVMGEALHEKSAEGKT